MSYYSWSGIKVPFWGAWGGSKCYNVCVSRTKNAECGVDAIGTKGNDSITGNGDTQISYQSATAGVTVDMIAGTAVGDASVGSDTFTGVSVETLLDVCGVASDATHVVAHTASGYTTNLPLEHFLARDALVAFTHDGEPLSAEHGGPARLIVPQLYAWKSAKWVAGLKFMEKDEAGFWEEGGYHMRVDPWLEERFR